MKQPLIEICVHIGYIVVRSIKIVFFNTLQTIIFEVFHPYSNLYDSEQITLLIYEPTSKTVNFG
jgi:hypothetical protein